MRKTPVMGLLALVGAAHGHGGMLNPIPRNAAAGQKAWSTSNKCSSQTPYSTAGFYAGEYCGLGCVGDTCLWYQIGCFVGCGTCSMTGKDLYPTPEDLSKAGQCKPIAATNNDKANKGYNIDGLSAHGDWSAVNPWRAPGTAGRGNPAFNPCGISSGSLPGFPDPPATGTTQGMNGTDLPAAADPTVWKRGEEKEVEWGIYANHAGGYAYRLCKKGPNGEITESACQDGHLDFAEETTTVKYYDGSREPFQINATTVSKGTFPAGSQWRKNPVPMCNCDIGQGCGKSSSDMYAPYSATHLRPGQTAERCPTGLQFPTKWDDGHGNGGYGTKGALGSFPFTMVDKVKVPADMAAGEYVLSWRWDCEQTPQVWNSCADIRVK
jgi:hypothetical protein